MCSFNITITSTGFKYTKDVVVDTVLDIETKISTKLHCWSLYETLYQIIIYENAWAVFAYISRVQVQYCNSINKLLGFTTKLVDSK